MGLPLNPITGPVDDTTLAAMSTDDVGNAYIVTDEGLLALPLPIIQAIFTIQETAPRIVSTSSNIAHLGRIGPVLLYSAPADGLYRVALCLSSAGIGPGGSTVSLQLDYFDLNGEQFPFIVTAFPLDSVGSASATTNVYLAASTDINFSAEITSGDGTEQYDLFVTLERLI